MATYSESEKARILSFPIASVLAHLGKRTDHRGEMFFSPFREENEPSFHIKSSENLWMDFGSGEGGNVLTLVSRLENIPLQKAWDFVAGLDPNIIVEDRPVRIERTDSPRKIFIESVKDISSTSLIAYASGRGIGRHLLQRYCSEVTFLIEGFSRSHTAIGFPAQENWVLRLPTERFYGKRCTGSSCSLLGPSGNAVTVPSCERVEVFEGFFDFLSWLVLKNRTKPFSDICVLNSVNNLHKAMPFIAPHGSVSCWLDNDRAGEAAFLQIKDAVPSAINHLEELREAGAKDVNEYLKSRTPETIVMQKTIQQPYSFTIKK